LQPLFDRLTSIVNLLGEFFWNTPPTAPFMVVMLVGTGIFLTLRMGFVQIRQFAHAVRVVTGGYDSPNDQGEITHFSALSTALSATIGVGNIAGVATAIHYGGPGALFWMWVTAFLGMCTKFVECTLATHFRDVSPTGEVSGGPMYYVAKGLGPNFKWLAGFMAVATVVATFGTGNAIQANTVADSLRSDFGIDPWMTGLVTTTLVGLTILGGIQRIASVTAVLAPLMAVVYVAGALLVLGACWRDVPAAFATIVSEAFTPTAASGGFAGSTIAFTIIWGVKRGLFSNEAGQGSAPIAHAAARTRFAVREGSVAILEPFIDTLVVCTMTGLAIVVTGAWHDKKPDSVKLEANSGLTIMKPEASFGLNATFDASGAFAGEAPIVEGVVQGVRFARNHSPVDEALIIDTVTGLPVTGTLAVDPARGVAVSNSAGAIIQAAVSGKMLQNGSPLTSFAFRRALGDWAGYIVTLSVLLFAISTAISWSYYGDRAMYYLVGAKGALPYRMAYIAVHFLGSIFHLEIVWAFGDVALGCMTLPNLIALLLLSGLVARLSREYFAGPHLEKG